MKTKYEEKQDTYQIFLYMEIICSDFSNKV